jgi:GDP-mannose 6-dehydrogenase
MNVSVIGLEQIGCISTACFARLGHVIIGADVDRQPGEFATAEPAPKLDPRFEQLIAEAASVGKFRRAVDVRSAVLESDVSLICAGTLSNANGSQNLRDLDGVFIQIGAALATKRKYHLIIVRTTVLPGTIEGRFTLLLQQHSGRLAGTDFGICMNPAFSWRTSGIEDIDHPPQIVIGELDSQSGDKAQQLYHGVDAPIIRTTIQTAEMLNYVSSAFHAVKITFANEIGNLCATHGINGQEVMEYFCLDHKLNVSSAYLRPGFAFGGPRLPRDLRALLHRAKEQEVECPLLNAVLPSNQQQISRAIELVEKTRRSKIAILGFGFKGMADVHENPVIHLAQTLTGKGYRVRIFDENMPLPGDADAEANVAVQDSGPQQNITRFVNPYLQKVIQDAEVIVLVSCGDAIRNVPKLLSENQILIDLAGAARESTVAPASKYATPG